MMSMGLLYCQYCAQAADLRQLALHGGRCLGLQLRDLHKETIQSNSEENGVEMLGMDAREGWVSLQKYTLKMMNVCHLMQYLCECLQGTIKGLFCELRDGSADPLANSMHQGSVSYRPT